MEQQERWQLTGSAAEHYERYTVAWLFDGLAARLIEGLPLRIGHRVLDVACGTGIVARHAAARVAPTGAVVGLDLNPGMLATARRIAAAAGLAIDFKQGDVNEMRFSEATFDAVFCQQGLQFFVDKAAALREMRRVLAPGGVVGIAVWGDPGPFIESLACVLSERLDPKLGQQCLAPFTLADIDVLRGLVSESGLRERELRTVSLTRRVEPTQDWLIRSTSGLPYGAAVAAMRPDARAAVVRHVASALKSYWVTDHFAVPQDVHLLYLAHP